MSDKEYNPLVSVTVITYNSSKYVLETLESIKAQTYQNIELIVSDDCSTDNTVEICREWIEKNKDRFVETHLITSPVNTGIPANKNRALAKCKGEWVKGIAGDDALVNDCIEHYIINAIEKPEVEVMHSNVIHYRGFLNEEFRLPTFDSASLKINKPDITAKDQFEFLLRGNKVWAGSLFLKMTIYEKVGLYDESVKYWEDRPMLLKITRNNIKLHYFDFFSCKYRKGASSIQSQKGSFELVSKFALEKNKYFLKNYLDYLPPFERFVKGVLLKRTIWVSRLTNNKRNYFSLGLLVVSGFPWKNLAKGIDKKFR